MANRAARNSQPPPASGPPANANGNNAVLNVPAPTSSRNNEFFVPRDGIDREVITADICRYLGQDALVRPGTYEAADGRVTQGYYVTAYRALTTAMIQDLKADSARWEQERRAAARNAPGSAGASANRAHNGSEYRDSTTHFNRQSTGPTGAGMYNDPRYGASGNNPNPNPNPDAMMIDSGYGPRYPGTGNQGYNGVNSGAHGGDYNAQYGQTGFPSQYPPRDAPMGNYPPQAADLRFGAFGGVTNPAFPPPHQEYIAGSNFNQSYNNQGNPIGAGMPGQSRPAYAGGGPQPGYGPPEPYYPGGGNPNYGGAQPLPHPGDIFYGRGNQQHLPLQPQQGYGSVPADAIANYDNAPAKPPASAMQARIPTPSSNAQAQMAGSGTNPVGPSQPPSNRADRERPRHREQGGRSDQDREERHTDNTNSNNNNNRHHRNNRGAR